MGDRLSNLDEGKKIKIINSAMEEFSKNTFQKASTNRIVEKAGISKGSLFNYFESKEKLYEYLEIFTIKAISDAIVEKVDWNEPDLLKRSKDVVIVKLEVCNKYPHLIGFSKRMNESKSIEEIRKRYAQYISNIYEKIFYENIDSTLFKENIGEAEITNILMWTFEKIGESYLKRIGDGEIIYTEEIAAEVDRYIEVLRKGFYK